MTIRTLLGKQPLTTDPVVDAHLSPHSMEALSHAEPELRRLIMAASKLINIEVLDARRGKAAQEAAFNHGFSKVHFGDSAHNYDPCIALDIVPEPLDWNNKAAFVRNYKVIGFFNPEKHTGMGLARDMKISCRCLGDPNMDGDTRDGWDYPHYERFPWRKYAQQSKLYRG